MSIDNNVLTRVIERFAHGGVDDALVLLVNLVGDSPTWLKTIDELANDALKMGEGDLSKAIYEHIKIIKPQSPIGYSGYARCLFFEGAWQICVDEWALCFRDFPQHVRPNWYRQQGNALLRLNRLAQATDVFESCISRFPKSPVGYESLAVGLQEKAYWREALRQWDICFELFPGLATDRWRRKRYLVLIELEQYEDAKIAATEIHLKKKNSYIDLILKQRFEKTRPKLKFNHILIITYGRSGSTLLQGVLNSIPGVLIRGENDNFFYSLYQAYAKLIHVQSSQKMASLPIHPWYGAPFYSQSSFLKHVQRLANDMLISDHMGSAETFITGFKEIRYHEVEDDLDLYLDFLQEIFPQSALIFNTRNINDLVQSGWWRDESSTDVCRMLKKFEDRVFVYAKGRENVFHITYDDLHSESPRLRQLFSFLGADFEESTLQTVFDVPHSYKKPGS